MEPRIIYKPAFTIVGLSQDGEAIKRSADHLWEELGTRFAEIPHVDPDVGFGVHIRPRNGHCYLVGFSVEGVGPVPEGMAEHHLDGHAYAVFTHSGHLDRLEETVQEIFTGWLPTSGYCSAGDFYFEYYDDHFSPDSADSTMFIFIPVKKVG
jgi:predicted transcriptional regulator YdeE